MSTSALEAKLAAGSAAALALKNAFRAAEPAAGNCQLFTATFTVNAEGKPGFLASAELRENHGLSFLDPVYIVAAWG